MEIEKEPPTYLWFPPKSLDFKNNIRSTNFIARTRRFRRVMLGRQSHVDDIHWIWLSYQNLLKYFPLLEHVNCGRWKVALLDDRFICKSKGMRSNQLSCYISISQHFWAVVPALYLECGGFSVPPDRPFAAHMLCGLVAGPTIAMLSRALWLFSWLMHFGYLHWLSVTVLATQYTPNPYTHTQTISFPNISRLQC